MGGKCCKAARRKPQSPETRDENSVLRNAARHSPSWSCRWDHRTHIEDIVDAPPPVVSGITENVQTDRKDGDSVPMERRSIGGSPSSNVSQPTRRRNTYRRIAAAKNLKAVQDELTCNNSPEVKESDKSVDVSSVGSEAKTSVSLPSTPTVILQAEPSSSRDQFLLSEPDSLRKARRSPGFQLCRQVMDTRIPSLKSLNEMSSPEGGRLSSSVISICSNDLSLGLPQGGSSDSWSIRAFSELVASSQRGERWSIDSDLLDSVSSKVARSLVLQSQSVSPNTKVCNACSKPLKERILWPSQELAVVAVLFCGHAYHADCLESLTSEGDKYDPPCPICTLGEKGTSKIHGKSEARSKHKASKITPSGTSGAKGFPGHPFFKWHLRG